MLAAFTISTGQPLTPSIVFTGLRLLSALRITAVIFLTDNILGLQETKVALRRIEVINVLFCIYCIRNMHMLMHSHTCI